MKEPLQPERLLVNAREAADMLSISTRTLWTLANMGTVPSVKINRARRYPVDGLRDYVADKMRIPTSSDSRNGGAK